MAKDRGFENVTHYLRHLVEQDKAGKEIVSQSLGSEGTQVNESELEGKYFLRQEDLLLALNHIDRKLDRYLGLTYSATKVNSHYEKLRNAIVALGLLNDNPAKLMGYLKELFKSEME